MRKSKYVYNEYSRNKFVRTYVWNVALYGSVIWIRGEQKRKRIKSFKI